MGAIRQQTFDDMDVHFMAILANRIFTIYIPMTVHEIIYITFIPLASYYDIPDIKFSCFGEQCEKLFRYILFCNDVTQMPSPLKKREDFLFCSFIKLLVFCLYFNLKIFPNSIKKAYHKTCAIYNLQPSFAVFIYYENATT